MRVIGELKKQLLEKFSEAELTKLIKEEMKQGARNEQSAMNKIANRTALETVGKSEVFGLFLGTYETRRENVSCYIGQSDTSVVKVSFDNMGQFNSIVGKTSKGLKVGDPMKLVGVDKVKNIYKDTEWLQAGDETKAVKPEFEGELWGIAQDVGQITEEGLSVIRGFIRWVNPVSIFEGGEPVDEEPIVTMKGGIEMVNLRLVVEEESKEPNPPAVTINLKTVAQYEALTKDKIGWLKEKLVSGDEGKETALMELSDMLTNVGIVAFGRAGITTPSGEPAKQPYLNIANFGWVIQAD